MNIISHLLGEILVNLNCITKDQLDDALREQEKMNKIRMAPSYADLISQGDTKESRVPLLGQIMIDKSYLTPEQLAPALKLQKEKEAALKSLEIKKLAITLELGCIINSSVDLEEVLSLIMKYANLVTDSVASTLMLLDEKSNELVFSVPTGPDADELKDTRIPFGSGIAGWVFEHEQPLIVNDPKNDDRFFSGVDKLTGSETACLLCVPMKSKRKLIGVLEVINKKDGSHFREEDVTLLSVFAHQAAIAIENATLFTSLQGQLEKEKIMSKELEESERFRVIGAVAGGIAHDFNNILSIIMGNSELLLMSSEDQNVRKRLSMIVDQAIRGKNLTRNLSAFSKMQDLRQELFSINEKIDFVIDILKKEFKGIEIKRQYEAKIPQLLADPGAIEHTLVNLLQNSIHAMSLSRNPELEIQTCYRDNRICFTITDNGCGIPEEYQQEVFKPLFTLKGSQDFSGSYKKSIQGTGYGMSNVKKYIAQHQGEITLQSVTGEGTSISVCLPVRMKDLSIPAKKQLEAFNPIPGKQVLLVENEIHMAELQAQLLKADPFHHIVHTAREGKAALKLTQTNAYDLVSLGQVNMGESGGIDLYRKIRAIDKSLPILFISGDFEFIESIKTLQANDPNLDHILKPFSGKDYLFAICSLLDKHKR